MPTLNIFIRFKDGLCVFGEERFERRVVIAGKTAEHGGEMTGLT
jgi:hypothetical protein